MQTLSTVLLSWYKENKRNLPWRGGKDAYPVWVSEIMLQQTRVETAIPYYKKWLQKFPTLIDLAHASEEEVLLLWEGLGYYARARNMHRTAKILIENHKAIFPHSPAMLQKLPGIGEYTANAIASICFGTPVAALDANGKRVFARLLDLDQPVSSNQAKKRIEQFATNLLEKADAGDFNQAIMDLGSLICIPLEPKCQNCPLPFFCDAYKQNTQSMRPVLKKKKVIPLYQVVAAAISDEAECYLLAKRPKGGMLPGLWEFPGGKVEDGEDDSTALQREIREELNTTISIGTLIGSYRHAYTHFRVEVRAYRCNLNGVMPQAVEAQELLWVRCEEMDRFAMGKVDRLISRDLVHDIPA